MARPQFRVLVTGSRTWTNSEVMYKALETIYSTAKEKLHKDTELVLVHGTARGADQMAARIWMTLGGSVEPHPADWDALPRTAGYVRNKEMVESGIDTVIAFSKNKSGGTRHCIRTANKAGLAVTVIEEND